MDRITFLVLFMVFAFCGTGTAAVITLWEGSIFEGELIEKKKDFVMLKVPEGTVGMPDEAVATIEDRVPTADEKAKSLSFKTERYDVTLQSDSMTPFEEEVIAETRVLLDEDPDMSDETITKITSEKFDLPTVIVNMILFKALSMSQ